MGYDVSEDQAIGEWGMRFGSCREYRTHVTYVHHSNHGLVESKIVGLVSDTDPSGLR